jgi:hypothetical protein
MDLRADTLPLLLQVLAIAVVARSTRPASTILAAALAALAFASKLSAVWAPLAIAAWLFARNRKGLAWFAAGYLGLAGGFVALLTVLTHGRILENVFGLSAAGITGSDSILVAPVRLLQLMVAQTTAAWLLFPFAALAAWLAISERRGSIYLVALVPALAVLLVTLSDRGTGRNQLLDVVVLAILGIGGIAGRRRQPAVSAASVVLGLALVIAIVGGAGATLIDPVKEAVRGTAAFSPHPLAGVANSRTRILSEDPLLPVTLGQDPVVLDAYMLLRIGRKDPEAIQALVDRIERREFDQIFLLFRIGDEEEGWYDRMQFGRSVIDAISQAYGYAGRVQGYQLYEPRDRSPGG